MLIFLWIALTVSIIIVIGSVYHLEQEPDIFAFILFLTLLGVILPTLTLVDVYSTKVSDSIEESYNAGYKDGQVQCIVGNVEYEELPDYLPDQIGDV